MDSIAVQFIKQTIEVEKLRVYEQQEHIRGMHKTIFNWMEELKTMEDNLKQLEADLKKLTAEE